MASENYKPWNININDFPSDGTEREKLIFLLNFAILAPSGHNSQPWNFSVSGNSISIFVDEKRSLSESDPFDSNTVTSLVLA